MQQFLGFVNYYQKFVKSSADYTNLLDKILTVSCKNSSNLGQTLFVWNGCEWEIETGIIFCGDYRHVILSCFGKSLYQGKVKKTVLHFGLCTNLEPPFICLKPLISVMITNDWMRKLQRYCDPITHFSCHWARLKIVC